MTTISTQQKMKSYPFTSAAVGVVALCFHARGVRAQQEPAYPSGLPLAGRISHVTSSVVNNGADIELFNGLSLATGPYPKGWATEPLETDDVNYTDVGYWLGNMVLELINWSEPSGANPTWISFDPATPGIVDSLNVTLAERGIETVVDPNYGVINGQSQLMFERFAAVDFPTASSDTTVQFSYFPSFSVLPLDYTYPTFEPQGSLGLLGVDTIVWSTNQSSLSEAAQGWAKLLNVANEVCADNDQNQSAVCFTPTSSYGVQGPPLKLVVGDREGWHSMEVTVASLEVAASALSAATSKNVTKPDLESGVDLVGLRWVFSEDPAWMPYFSGECQDPSFASQWTAQCSFATTGSAVKESVGGSAPEDDSSLDASGGVSMSLLSLSAIIAVTWSLTALCS